MCGFRHADGYVELLSERACTRLCEGGSRPPLLKNY